MNELLSQIECFWGAKKSPRHKMMASAQGCHSQSTDLQPRARVPAEGMPVDFPARQRGVPSTDLESCSSGLKSRGSKINRVLKYHHSFYKGIDLLFVGGDAAAVARWDVVTDYLPVYGLVR